MAYSVPKLLLRVFSLVRKQHRDANPAKDLIVAFAEDDSSILTRLISSNEPNHPVKVLFCHDTPHLLYYTKEIYWESITRLERNPLCPSSSLRISSLPEIN